MSKKQLERKLRAEQEETAFCFQEFIKTFQDVSPAPNKPFVRSGILNAKTGEEIETEKGQIYNPEPIIKQTSNMTMKNAIECARLLKENKPERHKGQEKPKTNLELLKEELKLRHLERGEKNKIKDDLSLYSFMGIFGSCDPTTTNLFIANIKPKITENDLIKIFGAYGPLASVKIMWPRNDEKNRTTNCGFVAFMCRSDAERAMSALKDVDEMSVRWGKPVEIPTHPIYVPPELLKSLIPPPHTGLPFNAQPIKQPYKYPTTNKEMEELLRNSIVKVTIPLGKRVLIIIHRLIEFVIREGPLFEAMIMNRELNNPDYQFLFDNQRAEHIYYRWKLYSIAQGESQRNWSTKEFRMFKTGSVWRPPLIPDYTKGMPDHLINLNSKVDKSMLSDAQRARFIQLIQGLNITKKKVGEAMVFCLNHVGAVKDIVDIVVDSFSNEATKAPKKLARLYLLSDVLYNSNMKKCYAPIYRTEFEKHLLEIVQQLHKTHNNLSMPSDKNIFNTKVIRVLKSWDLWKIYPIDFLNMLQSTFLGIAPENEADADSELDEPLDGANLIKRSIKNRAESLAKEEIKEKTFEPPKVPTPPPSPSLSGFIPSKWEVVDPEKVEAQAMSTKKFYDLEMERRIREKAEASPKKKVKSKPLVIDRNLLREIEVMVVHYQDDLESGRKKLKKGISLEKKLNSFRNHLLDKMRRNCKNKNRQSSTSSSSESSDSEKNEYKSHYNKHKKLTARQKSRKRSQK